MAEVHLGEHFQNDVYAAVARRLQNFFLISRFAVIEDLMRPLSLRQFEASRRPCSIQNLHTHSARDLERMILSGGFNVFHRIVEEAIYEHSAVAEVTVIGIPDPYRGQSAKAFIALKPGHAPFGIDELKAFLADKLAKYEMPTEIEIRSSLPNTPVGKLSKKELLAEEITKRQAADVAPVSPPEVARTGRRKLSE